MGFLLILSSVLILYGTLYPFDFAANAHPGGTLQIFIASLKEPPGRGDILSNVVLFLPFGFFASQCLFQRLPRLLVVILVTILGGSLSLGIECTQVYLPDRVTAVSDLVLNTAGTFFGAIFGWPRWHDTLARLQAGARPAALFPVILGGAWVGYRMFPYVPTIDLQHVKDAIKPLLHESLPPIDILRHFVVALVIGRLFEAVLPPGRARLATVVLVLGAIAAKPFIMTKIIMPAELVGAVAGVLVWVLVLSRMPGRTGIVALALAAQIVIQGLLPFNLRPEPVAFSFIPFIGFEGGSMSQNLQAFLEKVFLYGALVWLLTESGMSLILSIIGTCALLLGIELAQMYIVDRTSEITDPMLGAIMGAALYFMDRRQPVRLATAPSPA